MPRLPSGLTYNDLNGHEALECLDDWFRQLLATQPLLQPHLTLPMASIRLSVRVEVDMYVGGSVPVESSPERSSFEGAFELQNNLSNGSPSVSAAESFAAARVSAPAPQHTDTLLEAVVNAAPIPGGEPPDRVREKHGLAIPRPAVGPRETGSHIVLADFAVGGTKDDSQSGGRKGIVDPAYRFSEQTVTSVTAPKASRQEIPLAGGKIEIDSTGTGIDHAGIHVSAGTHVSSAKTFGDQAGRPYESVNGVYDLGPAGLMRGSQGGPRGLGGDRRPRISFGNSHRGS